jgi:hypothetical protein
VNHHLPPLWIDRLAGLMLFKASPQTRRLFEAWAKAEGGTAEWNPLNTTEPMPGATDYNTVGVKNYPTPISGISATALTLALEPYRSLWLDLQHGGYTAVQLVRRNGHCFDTWGTGAAHVLAELV